MKKEFNILKFSSANDVDMAFGRNTYSGIIEAHGPEIKKLRQKAISFGLAEGKAEMWREPKLVAWIAYYGKK